MAIDDEERGLSSRYNYSKPGQGAAGSQVAKPAPKMSTLPLTKSTKKPDIQLLRGIGVPRFFSNPSFDQPKNTMDAELNRKKKTLTLIVKIDFNFFNMYKRKVDKGNNIIKSTEVYKKWNSELMTKFIKRFSAKIHNEWSNKHELFPSEPCAEPVSSYKTTVVVLQANNDFHHTANIYFNGDVDIVMGPNKTKIGRLITANASHETHVMRLTDTDVVDAPGKVTISAGTFDVIHNVAVHEFGHLIGIDHINQAEANKDPSKNPYGETREQISDVMGSGNIVSIHDYWPFKVAMYYFTGCRWEAR